MINIEVRNSENENSLNVLRKFSKKIRSSGILKRAKSSKFHSRPKTKFSRKKHTLRTIKKRKEIERLIKLGKIQDTNANTQTKNRI